MQKILHEYKNVQVPKEAKAAIDCLFEQAKRTNPRIRKADVWLRAVNAVTLEQIITGE